MKKLAVLILAGALMAPAGIAAAKAKEAKADGKKLFETNCAVCHKDGGNIMKPEMNLKKATLVKNGIKNAGDIVNKMRNPGPGMTKFDDKKIPDKDAKAIGDYILKTFK